MDNNYRSLKGYLLGIMILLAAIGVMYAIKNFTREGQDNKVLTDNMDNEVDSTMQANIDSLIQAPITVLKKSGIPFVIKWGYYLGDKKANEGSSLTREWIVLNDEKCPIQLTNSVGINTVYTNSDLRFTATGNIETTEPITAYELHHIIYDVFGGHLTSLSNVEIADIDGSAAINKDDSWYATDNQIIEYILCASYVATVKTTAGITWSYNPLAIKRELNKIQITYEEDYRPPTGTDRK